MAKLHSASPREITSRFTREIISELNSKACNNLYIFHGSYSPYAKREISGHIPWKLFHGLVILFSNRHARSVVMSIFHCYVNNIKRI